MASSVHNEKSVGSQQSIIVLRETVVKRHAQS